jgi:hypothetical protein
MATSTRRIFVKRYIVSLKKKFWCRIPIKIRKKITDITFVIQRHCVFCQVYAEAEETVDY